MIQLVISLNIVIALLGFYVAWRIWLFKRALTAAAIAIASWERNTHRALDPEITPELILRGQQATSSLRERYARLEYQMQKLQKIFSLALVALRLLQRGNRRRRKLLRIR
ncbi:MAG: hypothetical protein AAFY20_03015 [Cyanobacteria bacterium J06639_14]